MKTVEDILSIIATAVSRAMPRYQNVSIIPRGGRDGHITEYAIVDEINGLRCEIGPLHVYDNGDKENNQIVVVFKGSESFTNASKLLAMIDDPSINVISHAPPEHSVISAIVKMVPDINRLHWNAAVSSFRA